MKECKIRDQELKLVEESNDNIRQSNFETSVQASQLGRITYCEILIIIMAFTIPTF